MFNLNTKFTEISTIAGHPTPRLPFPRLHCHQAAVHLRYIFLNLFTVYSIVISDGPKAVRDVYQEYIYNAIL